MRPFKKFMEVFTDAAVGGIRFCLYWQCRRDFNKAALIEETCVDFEADQPNRWPSIRVVQDGMIDEVHNFATELYQQAFVKALRGAKKEYLQRGHGVGYINGVLHSLFTKAQDDDPLSQLINTIRFDMHAEGEHIGTALSDVLLDFADDAFSPARNIQNPTLASAYLLNVMEAYPIMQEVYRGPDLQDRVRHILERARGSSLIEPILKEELEKNFRSLEPESVRPAHLLIG